MENKWIKPLRGLHDRIEIDHLRHFYSVARYGSFSQAAKKLHLQQSSLSRAVQLLEKQLGNTLFKRQRTGVTLTPVGNEILVHCHRIFGEIADIRNVADSKKNGCSGDFFIGASDQISNHMLPKVLASLLQLHPRLNPRIITGASRQVCSDLISEEIELALLMTVPEEAGIKIVTIAEIPHHVVVATQYRNSPTVYQSFIGSREIDNPRGVSFPTVGALSQRYPDIKITVSSNSIGMQKQLVLEGMGIAILPDFMIGEELKNNVFELVIPDFCFKAKVLLATKSDYRPSESAKLLTKIFKEMYHAKST